MDFSQARDYTLAILAENHTYGYSIKMDRSFRRFGQTRFEPMEIGYSAHMFLNNTDKEIFDVIYHECAHAILGPGYGHGITWRNLCIYLGGNGQQREPSNAAQKANRAAKNANPLYMAYCPKCEKNVGGFHRAVKKTYFHSLCKTPIVLTRTR